MHEIGGDHTRREIRSPGQIVPGAFYIPDRRLQSLVWSLGIRFERWGM